MLRLIQECYKLGISFRYDFVFTVKETYEEVEIIKNGKYIEATPLNLETLMKSFAGYEEETEDALIFRIPYV